MLFRYSSIDKGKPPETQTSKSIKSPNIQQATSNNHHYHHDQLGLSAAFTSVGPKLLPKYYIIYRYTYVQICIFIIIIINLTIVIIIIIIFIIIFILIFIIISLVVAGFLIICCYLCMFPMFLKLMFRARASSVCL